MEPTTADGSPLVVRGSYIPIEWSIFQWPPRREVSLAYIARKLSDPALHDLHGVSATSIMMMMSSDDECHQAAKRIEEEAFNACADDSGLPAFNAYADEPAQIDSALPAFRDYWSKIREAIITTVKSRGPRPPSPNPPRDFIPMEETEPKVYHDRDENDRNDEVDNKKKAKLLEEGGAKSRPAPQEGMVRRDFVIFKKPYSTGPPVSFEDSHRGFYKHLLRKKPKPTTLPDDGHPPPGPSPPVSAKNFICGQAQPFDLSDDEESHVANLLASEAVKEYNNRQFEDKLELVKVTKGTVSGVAGHLFNLTFDAKVLGDGGGGTTKTYHAKVWLKIEGTLQVISFKLTDDGQGKATITTYIG